MEESKNIPNAPTPPDWSIEDLYKKAWAIVRNNKVLWIFAAAAGGGMSFNNSFSNSFNSDGNDFYKLQQFFQNNPDVGSEKLSVLGAASSSLPDIFSQLITPVNIGLLIFLILEFLLLMLFGIIITLTYQAFANGALLESIQTCIKGGKANITDSANAAFKHIKRLIFLQIVPGLITALVFVIGFLIAGMGIALSNGIVRGYFILSIIALIVIAFVSFIMLTLILIWATRIVVVENTTALESLSKAFILAKKKFWSSLLLGIVNSVLTGILTLIPIFIMIVVVIGGLILAWQVESLRIPLVVFSVPLLLSVIVVLTIATAVIHAFKATVWSLAYNSVKDKYFKNVSNDK